MKTLLDLVDDYELSTEISSDYAYQLRYAVRRLSRWLGREAIADDLKKKIINRWLLDESKSNAIGDRSRKNVRVSILTLWHKYGSRRLDRDSIRSVTVTPRNPEAWTFEQLEKVAEAAKELPGRLSNGLPRSLYFPTCLWFAYETGLRRRDLWQFDLDTFDADRVAALTQHKTKRVHLITITAETEADLRGIQRKLRHSGDPFSSTPLRWPQSPSQFYYWMKKARKIAAVDVDVSNRCIQHARRTGATEIDRQGDDASRYLGHATQWMARKHYIDARKTIRPIIPTANRSGERARTG